MYCLKPKLKSVPQGDWYCNDCKPKDRVKTPKKKSRQGFSEEDNEDEKEEKEDDEEEEEENGNSSDEVSPLFFVKLTISCPVAKDFFANIL